MLIKDFYTVKSSQDIDDNRHEVMVSLNPKAEVYKGHFVGQPVAPGAILTQMVKEVANDIIGKNLMLTEAQQIKFLATVNPNKTSELKLDLDISKAENGYRFKCVAKNDNTSYFKISGTLA